MDRLFPVLAALALTLMAVALWLGLSVGDLHILSDEVRAASRAAEPLEPATEAALTAALGAKSRHFLWGVLACLAVVFVDSIAITYFIGTSRWCKEVSETYGLDRRFVARSTQLKRRTFPVATLSMLLVVLLASLGAAADPGAALQIEPPLGRWHQWHLAAALGGMALVGLAFYVQWNNILSNGRVIADVMAEVRRVRTERGLEVVA